MLMPKAPVIKNENERLAELVLCIISSQEKFEVAAGAVGQLKRENALRAPRNERDLALIRSQISRILASPITFAYKNKSYSRRLRFFGNKSQQVFDTLGNIYHGGLTIGKILDGKQCAQETRKNVIDYCSGIGPKQASMFLRNIGYCSDFAILDKHVIDFMKILGLTWKPKSSPATLSAYRQIEENLIDYATANNVRMLHLDIAIWVTMRMVRGQIV